MKTGIITLGDINGSSLNLPDKQIIHEAQRNKCMSPFFWDKIKAGKIPYIFNKEKNELVEANYTETVITKGPGNIYWVTDAEYPELNEILKNATAAEDLKQSYLQKIEKFK